MVTLTDAQRGYLAGIIDGEGHISVNRYARRDSKKRLRNYGLKVNVRIVQARIELLHYIHGMVGLDSACIGRSGKDNAYFCLRFNHACLKWLLPQLKGHLFLKTRQAEIVEQFLYFPRYTGRRGVGDVEWQHREMLFDECRQLNITPQKRNRLRHVRA